MKKTVNNSQKSNNDLRFLISNTDKYISTPVTIIKRISTKFYSKSLFFYKIRGCNGFFY